MNTALACLLFSLLVGACLSRPAANIKHRKGWGDRLDEGDPAVQSLLKETEVQDGSGGYHDRRRDFGEPVDNEPDTDFQYEEQLLLHHGSCVHPVTKHPIAVGSFDFSYETCLLCQCPNGKLKCSHTC